MLLSLETNGLVFLDGQKKALLAEWVRRSASDARLTPATRLPNREKVCAIRAILSETIRVCGSRQRSGRENTELHDACRVLRTAYTPSETALEFSHLRATLQAAALRCDVLSATERAMLAERLGRRLDELLADALSTCTASDAHDTQLDPDHGEERVTLEVVSHELRSGLTPLFTWLNVLNTQLAHGLADQPELLARACQGMQRSARTLKRLVDDLHEFAALSRGRISMVRAEADLNALAGACAAGLTPQAEAANVRLRFEPAAESVRVHGDETRLQQCIMNLLNNALKFTPEHGLITLRVSRENQDAVVEVSDTGMGISDADLARLFEPFWHRAKGSKATGLGLGLAIVKAIVETHGGTVEAFSSGDGQGSTFRLSLPVIG